MSQFHSHYKPGLVIRLKSYFLKLRGIRVGSQSYVGKKSEILRFPKNVIIGNRTIVKNHVQICATNHNAKINIGDDCTIGDHTYIYASCEIIIGNNVLIAPFCYLVDANHGTLKSKTIRSQELEKRPIHIGDDVWLGAQVKVLAGVSVKTGSIVAAGSTVTSDTQPYAIYAGSPAKLVGYRK